MKTFFKFLMVLNLVVIVGCSNDDSPTNVDPIVGKWKRISETDNGVPEVLDACDLMSRYEFLADGNYINEDYDMTGGSCVLEPNGGLPEGSTYKWAKVSDGNYKYILTVPGMPESVEINFMAVFSNNNNTITTTYIEDAGTPDQNIQVSVNERVN